MPGVGLLLEYFNREETYMRRAQFLLLVAFLFLCASSTVAQSPVQNDGAVVEQAPCAPNTIGTYEQYVESSKRTFAEEVETAKRVGFPMEMPSNFTAHLLGKEEFERQKAYAGFECRRIKYLSDGLKVVGFIWKPKNAEGKKLPLIIVNHGGNGDLGKLTPWVQFGYYRYVSSGFVVIGPQYRGVDGGEGSDEFGGADLHDVMNLIPLAKSLGYVDVNNIFMVGASRGGMMAYLALKNNAPVNAVAVISGMADLLSSGKERVGMVNVYKRLIPDFEKRGEELLRERSAVYWADKINAPVLLLQGTADWRVNTGQVLALAQKLQESGKTYELIVYADDYHGVPLNRADADRRIVEWFRMHMK
jgi:dipeptidyl aminopeptidase/acylaminoacyl peptidase